MATGLLAKKVGMTQIFTPEGDCVPVTVLEAGPCTVVRRKTAEKDGYDAVVIGFGPMDEKHARRLTKPEVGVFKKAGTPIFRHLKEVRVKDAKLLGDLKAGDVLTVDKVFKANQRIDVSGRTKGRGFQGVFKKWGMKGAARDSSTSHEHHRHIGAIGQRKTPGRVYPNKKLPGHYGVETVTTQNLEVVGLHPEKNIILVKGGVAGSNNGLVVIKPSVKLALRAAHKAKASKK